MRIRGLHRLRWAAERLRNRYDPGVVVLAYHRIADLSRDPLRNAVTPRHFAEHLDVLSRHGPVLSLAGLIEALRTGRTLPRRASVITFDDGYVDNLRDALPLLRRHGMPATIFVTTGAVGREREFWWDELESLLFSAPSSLGELRLNVDGSARVFRLEPRERLFGVLHRILLDCSEDARPAILDDLRTWAHGPRQPRPSHRTLDVAELRALARDDLVEIGAHTVNHPMLTALPLAGQQAEVHGSRRALDLILGSPPHSFSYPYGAHSRNTTAVVRGAGFACAVASRRGFVWSGANPFSLPRVEVRDCDGEDLARQLETGNLRT